mgnify:FL=1
MLSKKAVRIVSVVIAIALLITMVAGGIISIMSTASAASVSELKDQLSSIESQKKELQSVLDNLQGEIENTTEKITVLTDQIKVTKSDIQKTEEIIESYDDQIADKEVEIEEAQVKLDEQTELFETRMRVMYENGNDIGYLDVILGSKSFSDMLSRLEIVSEIMQSDKKIVNDFKQAKADLEDAKQALVDSQNEQKAYKESLEQKNETLESQRDELETTKSKLEGDADKADAEKAALEAEKQAIRDEIAEISRKSAEEAAKKAQQQQQSNSSSNNSSGGGSSVPSGSGTISVWPAPSYSRISSGFGYRGAPTAGASTYHKGVDLAGPSNSAIVAAGSGTVVKSYYSSSYGNYVAIDHGGGIVTGYAHMNSRLVSVGQTVSAGQQIGKLGSTGISTGPHLHFEVFVNGSAVNPMNYF